MKYKESKLTKKDPKNSPPAIKLPNMLFFHLKGNSRSNVTRITGQSFCNMDTPPSTSEHSPMKEGGKLATM